MPRIAVFGLGQFGSALATALASKGVEVMAFDRDKECVEDIKGRVAVAVQLDSTDERALRAVGLEQVETAVVTMGSDILANILTCALLKKLNIRHVLARAATPLQEEILKAIGVERILVVERDMGEELATNLALVGVHRFYALATGHSLVEIDLPEWLVGKTIEQAQLRQRYNVNIVGIKRRVPDVDDRGGRTEREEVNLVPKPSDTLEDGDVLILAGEDEDIQAIVKG